MNPVLGVLLIFAVIVAATLFMSALVWGFVIFPIWMIIHCASSQRSAKAKAVWIVAMLLAWPVAQLIYGLVAANRRFARWSGAIGLLLLLVLFGLMAAGLPALSREVNQQLEEAVQNLPRLSLQALSADERLAFEQALKTLQQELSRAGRFQRLRLHAQYDPLLKLLSFYAQDGEVAHTEYSDWMGKYTSRAVLDAGALKQQILRMRLEQWRQKRAE